MLLSGRKTMNLDRLRSYIVSCGTCSLWKLPGTGCSTWNIGISSAFRHGDNEFCMRFSFFTLAFDGYAALVHDGDSLIYGIVK